MSKNIQLPQSGTDPGLLASQQAAGPNLFAGANVPPDIWDLQRKIYALQYAQLSRAAADAEEIERQQKGQRLQGALDMQKRRDREMMVQKACPHMKPNFTPCIGGQRDHQGAYHFICGYCAKEFTGTDLPAHLRIPLERVGGPEH